MKYSENFEKDFMFYMRNRHKFKFDGRSEYYDKKGNNLVVYDTKGVDGKRAFYAYDSEGKILPTKHPNLLTALLRTKGSVNLHIKMFAEDRAHGRYPYIEFRAFCISIGAPQWFREAVENQKYRYYSEVPELKNIKDGY